MITESPTINPEDYEKITNQQLAPEIAGKTERFIYKFFDIWKECNGDRFETLYDICLSLFMTSTNEWMDSFLTTLKK
jgi:hypothetical protein